MYFLHVLKSIFRPANIGTIIFFLLNAAFMVMYLSNGEPEGMLIVGVVYIFSVILALSPLGEWVVAFFAGARKLKRKDMKDKITPIVEKVYKAAYEKSGRALGRVIILKVMHDPEPNAYAIGRRTICVTEGLLDLSDEMIEGIIAHELGHLAMHHTVIQLMIGGGNFFITGFILIFKIIHYIKGFWAALDLFRKGGEDIVGLIFNLIDILTAVLVWLWTRFCMLFLCWSGRANEYEADKYAAEIGYGYNLAAALDLIGNGKPNNSFLKALYASHPATHDRIAKLQELGVPYSRYA
ncbi:MAG: M48 family metalloprotease [Lachnospiraceae bacterium]|nr:M48 family metalloprotease [Lachnospiraceae bacterium]